LVTAAIASASLNRLDRLSQTIWQGHTTGAISDDQAQQLAEQIQTRRQLARAERKPRAGRSPSLSGDILHFEPGSVAALSKTLTAGLDSQAGPYGIFWYNADGTSSQRPLLFAP
jgi:hypothetical protein